MFPTRYLSSNKTGTVPVEKKKKIHPKLAEIDRKAIEKTEFSANKNKTNSGKNNENKPETDAECADIIIELYNKKNQNKDDIDLITHRCYTQLRRTHKNTNQEQEDEKKQNWEVVIDENPEIYDTLNQIFPKSKFKKGDIVYYENLEGKIIELDTRNLEHLVEFVDKKEIIINKKDLKQIVEKDKLGKKTILSKLSSLFISNKHYNDRIDVEPSSLLDNLLDGIYMYKNKLVIPIAYGGDYYKIRFRDSIRVEEDQLKDEDQLEDKKVKAEDKLSDDIKKELAKTEENLNKARKEKNSLNYLKGEWNKKKLNEEKERLKEEEASHHSGGKRKSRRNRKTKKGKRSRKARKSRRKSKRRRGRR